jgi:hypothetical protein
MSKKFKVKFNFVGSVSYEIEADSFKDALKKASDKASLADGEAYDWDDRNQGEVTCGEESRRIEDLD